jgi:peptide/nickel transport system permease protein
MVIPVMLVVTIGIFILETFLPGDEALTLAGPSATPERVQEIRKALHLDEPLPERYLNWVSHALRGDLGDSLYTRRSVWDQISSAWLVSLSLVLSALVLALLISAPIALYAGSHPHSIVDRIVSVACAFAVAIPDFVLGMIAIIVFGLHLKVLPLTGWVSLTDDPVQFLRHMILPALALSAAMSAVIIRQLRSNIADVMHDDFIRTATAKGLRRRVVLVKHALLAAAPPTVSILGVQVARLLGGVVVVETVFGISGLGFLTVTAIQQRDLPMIQGIIPLLVLVAIVANLLADLLNGRLDPRLRHRVEAA